MTFPVRFSGKPAASTLCRHASAFRLTALLGASAHAFAQSRPMLSPQPRELQAGELFPVHIADGRGPRRRRGRLLRRAESRNGADAERPTRLSLQPEPST